MARRKRRHTTETVGGLTAELVDVLAAGVQTPADLHDL